MTVTAQIPRSGPFTGDGSTVAFTYGFLIEANTELVVTVRNTLTEVLTVKTLTTDYSVAGVGIVSGGTVTFVTAPTATEEVAFTRSVVLSQGLDLQNRGVVSPALLEGKYDDLYRIAQDNAEALGRAVKVDIFNVVDVDQLTANLTVLAAITGEITTVASLEAAIGTVNTNAADIITVAGISANVNTVAGISADVTTVAADGTDIGTVSTNIANVNTVAGISAAVSTVAADATDIGTVSTNIANVNTVAGISANVTTVAGISGNVTTVASISADVTTVAADGTDIGTVSTNIANVNTVAGISANVTTVAGISADVTQVAADTIPINAASANAAAAADSAAAAAASYDAFDDRYLGSKASAPTLDNDGNALLVGALYFDTVLDATRVYNGTIWSAAFVPTSDTLLESELTDVAAVKALNQGAATTDSPTFAGLTVNGNNYPSAGSLAGRNLIINGTGRTNQRSYTGGDATVGANQFTRDRWFVVTSGQSLGVSGTDAGTVMTAPAGGVSQVIEGGNVVGGTYVINWTGTATATVGGIARAKGDTFTLTVDTNTTVTFSSGTFSEVQVELGTVATPFEKVDIGVEQSKCQRYYLQFTYRARFEAVNSGAADGRILPLPVRMRGSPTVTKTQTTSVNVTSATFSSTDNSFTAEVVPSAAGGTDYVADLSLDAEIIA